MLGHKMSCQRAQFQSAAATSIFSYTELIAIQNVQPLSFAEFSNQRICRKIIEILLDKNQWAKCNFSHVRRSFQSICCCERQNKRQTLWHRKISRGRSADFLYVCAACVTLACKGVHENSMAHNFCSFSAADDILDIWYSTMEKFV